LAAAAPDDLVDRETLNDVGATKSPVAKADPEKPPLEWAVAREPPAEVHPEVAAPEVAAQRPQPETETKTLDALLAALNGSAERFQTLWFSFLGLTLYLAIAALATTHRNLLLGESQTLPILNIKVELLAFLYHRAAALFRLSLLSLDDAGPARAHSCAVRDRAA
jgi:hypothetical protein